jgi:crotonobetainyl-CoA:carnitine CoA-transferase CaiB-like acyl-CoA transferase
LAKPLKGIQVLDLSRLLPGPFCSLILADLGAEVIKVEDPSGGDYARWLPPLKNDVGIYFLALNRNKKSITLHLRTPKGVELFKKLARTADVILESFRPGVLDRLGIGYKVLKKINPKIIFCSITGYGQDGPYRDLAGHDLNYIGLSGVLGLTGKSPDEIAIPGVQVADVGGGSLFGAVAILAGLIERKKTGKGRLLDISMTDGAFSLLTMHLVRYLMERGSLRPAKLPLNGAWPCYRPYRTKDGKFVALGAIEPKFWEQFCRASKRKDLLSDAYSEDPQIFSKVEEIFAQKTRSEWVELGARFDFCCTPIYQDEEIVQNPHVKARNLIFDLEHPTEGKIPQIRIPLNFSDSSKKRRDSPPPALGGDNLKVFKALGISPKELQKLKKEGVL